jgi:hypothetical protein
MISVIKPTNQSDRVLVERRLRTVMRYVLLSMKPILSPVHPLVVALILAGVAICVALPVEIGQAIERASVD